MSAETQDVISQGESRSQAPAANPLAILSADELGARINSYRIELPVKTIREIQRRKEEMVPVLIRIIENSAARIRSGEFGITNGPCLVLALLIEFRAEAALDALLAAVSLPGEGPYDLFGDLVTEMFPLVVPSVAQDRIENVLRVIRDQARDEFVRHSLVTGLTLRYDAGQKTRDAVIELLRALLHEAIENNDAPLGNAVASAAIDLNAVELCELVRAAFAANLIDPDMAGDVDRFEEYLIKFLWKPRPWTVEDTVLEMKDWYEEDKRLFLTIMITLKISTMSLRTRPFSASIQRSPSPFVMNLVASAATSPAPAAAGRSSRSAVVNQGARNFLQQFR